MCTLEEREGQCHLISENSMSEGRGWVSGGFCSPLRALGLRGSMELSSPPGSHLEEGLLIAGWRAANEPAKDLGSGSDGAKGLP